VTKSGRIAANPRLGLVTLEQMTNALMVAAENPAMGRKIVEVPEIRNADRVKTSAIQGVSAS